MIRPGPNAALVALLLALAAGCAEREHAAPQPPAPDTTRAATTPMVAPDEIVAGSPEDTLGPPPGDETALGDVSGTYEARWGEAGCTLRLAELPGQKLRFALDCVSGDHIGSAAGTVPFVGGAAVYRTTEHVGLCELRFQFDVGRVEIEQTGTEADCGFGLGVRAIGQYERVSTEQPTLDDDR